MKKASTRDRVEREMLRLLTQDPTLFQAYAARLTDDHVRTPAGRAVLSALRASNGDVGAIAGGDDPKLAAAVSALAVEELEGEPSEDYAAHVFDRLQEFVLKAKSDELRITLQKKNPQTDADYDDLFQRLVTIDGELRRLRQRMQEGR
jgi:hypothetical protein